MGCSDSKANSHQSRQLHRQASAELAMGNLQINEKAGKFFDVNPNTLPRGTSDKAQALLIGKNNQIPGQTVGIQSNPQNTTQTGGKWTEKIEAQLKKDKAMVGDKIAKQNETSKNLAKQNAADCKKEQEKNKKLADEAKAKEKAQIAKMKENAKKQKAAEDKAKKDAKKASKPVKKGK